MTIPVWFVFNCHFCTITVSKCGQAPLHKAALTSDKGMCGCLLQHGADVNGNDNVSFCCQLFYLLLIMVQVCVLPNNLRFGSHLSG